MIPDFDRHRPVPSNRLSVTSSEWMSCLPKDFMLHPDSGRLYLQNQLVAERGEDHHWYSVSSASHVVRGLSEFLVELCQEAITEREQANATSKQQTMLAALRRSALATSTWDRWLRYVV